MKHACKYITIKAIAMLVCEFHTTVKKSTIIV